MVQWSGLRLGYVKTNAELRKELEHMLHTFSVQPVGCMCPRFPPIIMH